MTNLEPATKFEKKRYAVLQPLNKGLYEFVQITYLIRANIELTENFLQNFNRKDEDGNQISNVFKTL